MSNEEFYLSDAIDVIEEVLSGGGEFRMYPKGTSMLPLIRQGIDSVVLMRRSDGRVKKGDIAFYRRESGAFVLHRVMRVQGDGTLVMCGDNQTVYEKNVKPSQIIGYVGRIHRGEDLLAIDSFKYRFYVTVWCFMPLRRTISFVRRVFSGVKRRVLKK